MPKMPLGVDLPRVRQTPIIEIEHSETQKTIHLPLRYYHGTRQEIKISQDIRIYQFPSPTGCQIWKSRFNLPYTLETLSTSC